MKWNDQSDCIYKVVDRECLSCLVGLSFQPLALVRVQAIHAIHQSRAEAIRYKDRSNVSSRSRGLIVLCLVLCMAAPVSDGSSISLPPDDIPPSSTDTRTESEAVFFVYLEMNLYSSSHA